LSQQTKYRDPHQGYRRVSEKRRAQRVIEAALAMARAESEAELDDRADAGLVATADLVSLMANQSDVATKPTAASVSPQSAGNQSSAAGEGRMIEVRGTTTRVVRGVMADTSERESGGGDAVDRLLASIRRHR
jgi:hypothetical protein